MNDINLLATTDAKVWAEEFMRMHGYKLPDEGLMIAWFANMWAATHDPMLAEIERLEIENAKLNNYMQRVKDAVKSFEALSPTQGPE